MGVKTHSHAGQRRIFFVLDRATRKFHGDLGLWMQYLGFARQQKASKKVSQILTSVLRLHPTRPELWIYAAKYAMDERGDLTEARSYMQRGLRFCKHSKNLWIEYAKLEMIYMAKIAGRRQILGLDEELSGMESTPNIDSMHANIVPLPALTTTDMDPTQQPQDVVDQDTLQKLSETPALSGAIPIAIFDAAIKQLEGDARIGEEFLDMFAEFQGIPCVHKIRHHVVDVLLAQAPLDPVALTCFIREPVIGIKVLSVAFPGALGVALDRLRTTLQETLPFSSSPIITRSRIALSSRIVDWILAFVDVQDLDQDILEVLMATLQKLLGQYGASLDQIPESNDNEIAKLASKLLEKGLKDLAKLLLTFGLQPSPCGPRSLSLQN